MVRTRQILGIDETHSNTAQEGESTEEVQRGYIDRCAGGQLAEASKGVEQAHLAMLLI